MKNLGTLSAALIVENRSTGNPYLEALLQGPLQTGLDLLAAGPNALKGMSYLEGRSLSLVAKDELGASGNHVKPPPVSPDPGKSTPPGLVPGETKIVSPGTTAANDAKFAAGNAEVGIQPRINIADDFIKTTNKNGSTTLRYGNPEGVQGLIVDVDKKGILGFDVRSSGSPGSPSGTDMFSSAMNKLSQEGVEVKAIRGAWVQGTDSVNTAEYLSNLSKGMSPQQAAANTWTGRTAAKYGFTIVEQPVQSSLSNMTTVIFRKP